MKTIYEYEDYREYLRDYYAESKKEKRFFTHRYFAAKAGLASPMHLKLVMSGERNLTHKTLTKFVNGLGLNEKEGEYFENLVFFSQAKTSAEKSRFLGKLSRIKTGGQATRISDKQQKSLFARWYYPVIYEMTLVKGFSEDGAWISKRLRKAITPAEAARAVKDLEDSGLLTRDGDGRLRQQSYRVRTDDEVENLLVREYHRTMAVKAADHVDDPLDRREYGFVTVSTSKERAQKMKQLVKEFVKNANELLTCAPQSGEATEVVQLNVQMFEVG